MSKQFKLTMRLILTEVEEFNPSESVDVDVPDTEVDPVKRDEKGINRLISLAEQQFTSINKRPSLPLCPPSSEITVTRYFDVPASDLTQVAKVINRFEELGSEIGMATNVPPPDKGYYGLRVG